MLNDAVEVSRRALADAFRLSALELDASWEISGRAVSEIGGRLIEDFVLSQLPLSLANFAEGWDAIESHVPGSGRAIEDIGVTLRRGDSFVRLLIDVKGHNELRPGSRPNLASIRKCIELYSDPARANDEVVVFFCRYVPSVSPGSRSAKLSYTVRPDSFGDTGVFLLRELGERNLDPANIGSGGQILLARENRIELVRRSRSDFVTLLQRFRDRLRLS